MTDDRTTPTRRVRLIKVAGLVLAMSALAMFGAAAPASADNAPPLACGSTQPGPCSETAHFTSEQMFVTPLTPPTSPSNCPAFLLSDIPLLNFTGHGVEHTTVNKAQDAWFTSTFAGTGTITLYPPSSLANIVMDDQGNIVSADIVGPADAVLTGHLTNWFGGSFNNKNAVLHDTINFSGTDQSGAAMQIHAVDHTSWNATTMPFVDPPSLDFHNATC
jgi:hypothetical protein